MAKGCPKHPMVESLSYYDKFKDVKNPPIIMSSLLRFWRTLGVHGWGFHNQSIWMSIRGQTSSHLVQVGVYNHWQKVVCICLLGKAATLISCLMHLCSTPRVMGKKQHNIFFFRKGDGELIIQNKSLNKSLKVKKIYIYET